ncbi:hypothetical protein ACFL3T_01470 [Patescibacteria group bacterium]
MKKVLAIIALVAAVAVSSVAHADVFTLDTNVGLESALEFSNDCADTLTITGTGTGSVMVNNELGIPDSCNFDAYSNNSLGSNLTVGNDDAMDNTETVPDVWADIGNPGTYTLVAGTEAWGWYISSATGHTTDTDGTNPFVNAVPNYFDLGATETALDTATPIDPTGAFTLTVNAASSLTTPAGAYDADMVLTYTDN